MARFVGSRLTREFLQIAEFVHPIQQTGAREGIDREADGVLTRPSHACSAEIDRHGEVMIFSPRREQGRVLGRLDHDWNQPIFKRVAFKNIGKHRGNNDLKTPTD